MIKRDLEIKDISSWLPGHGGFLDRLDSILPSAAAAYALFLLVR
jgi:phosphatidate cytidylyltransferase